MRYISQFEASDIDSDDIDLRFEVDGTETGTTVSIVDECGHAAQIITALLDELETKEEQRANWFQMAQKLGEDLDAAEKRIAEQREYYEGVIADGSKRIAELERSETQLISERDDAESALNDAYKAVMGQPPEWSNWFSFENAIDEIELACELWRNQTDDVIQFLQRIAELEAREVILPDRKSEIFWPGDAAEFDSLGYVIAVKSAIRAAGIKVKES
ncbi:ead/Ea22-like family protein [Salmonella enterica]|nr:ead/Ea22-like family protein [Salmonella enterica]EJX3843038.1 ead/Ea22-like family protein [Salmonella enterica]EJX5169954.1 ead/Ea22-like family protein [Salmonella enterica]